MTQRRRQRYSGASAILGIVLGAGLVPTSTASGQAVILIHSSVGAQHLADTTVRLDPGIAIVSPVGGGSRDSFPLFLAPP
jgi:hypothetical protein